ncbi:MAG: antibiotic biosynthesis monooxygenase [Gammaproteobacteria bacterium]
MHATLVQLHIKIEHLADFLSAVKANHEASVQEPGNLRFDVLQSRVDPTRFLLYELYASAEDAAAHRETAHYKKWNARVPDWFASDRQATEYRCLHPSQTVEVLEAQFIDGA